MKKRTAVSAFLLLMIVAPAVAQRTITKTNLLLGPLFKTIYTTQEVKVGPRITIQTSVKTRPPARYKFGLGAVRVDGTDYNPFDGGLKMSGAGNITEFRVYGKEKGAFNGFYWGPYTSYMFYKVFSEPTPATFTDANGVKHTADLTQEIRVNLGGAGFQIGVQKMFFKNHMCIDWTILGVGFGGLKLKGVVEATNTSEGFDFRNYQDDLDDHHFGIEKLFTFDRTTEANNVSVSLGTPIFMMRTALSIGFAY